MENELFLDLDEDDDYDDDVLDIIDLFFHQMASKIFYYYVPEPAAEPFMDKFRDSISEISRNVKDSKAIKVRATFLIDKECNQDVFNNILLEIDLAFNNEYDRHHMVDFDNGEIKRQLAMLVEEETIHILIYQEKEGVKTEVFSLSYLYNKNKVGSISIDKVLFKDYRWIILSFTEYFCEYSPCVLDALFDELAKD